ncbi:hypothetical protein POJ06DRAFT_266771 [Lipomyces tetrasporus]|uniref:Uncharacterized protein n=1 Tax=Lipomyces tetrasporus TaxID=54092 RepID=A0AAD7QVA5_9ASCO|nr:uncharacterized protein POJ06DRAFT_266771 [Lipomyces tetrasporus]KAJ8102163.1 hypothetical protein POJ06DRAFT_266771 [Lipomyces tetrasporus]
MASERSGIAIVNILAVLHSRAKFDAGRAFDLEDDLEFCPSLLSEEEIQSATTYSSDRSSTSGSPESSPLQTQVRPSNSGMLGQLSPGMSPGRPGAHRARRAIEIVDPATGLRVASPPLSSPAKMIYPSAHSTPSRKAWS